MKINLPPFIRKLANPRGWAYGLFWSWNLIFLAFMLFGFAPQVLPEMLIAARQGDIPPDFLVYAVILTAIPVLVVILGLTVLRRQPGRLFSLGYGVEGPLMLLLALRFFAIRELTPAVALLLAVTGLGLLTLFWQLLDFHIDERGAGLTILRGIGLTLLLLAGLYASLWLAFYALPIGFRSGEVFNNIVGEGWRGIRDLDWEELARQWRRLPFIVLGVTLGLYSGTLFVLMPLAIPILYGRAWWRGLHNLAVRTRPLMAAALVMVVAAVLAVLLVLTNRQPQQRAFALLENPPANRAEAEALLERQATIRAGLLNAYLASFRYFGSVGEVYHIRDLYHWAFDVPRERSGPVQRLYEVVARPVLYLPVDPLAELPARRSDQRAMRREAQEAAALYGTFFDQPINEGEHEAVVRAVRSTWSVDQAQAAWQAVDDREIRLLRQELTVNEHGDWAEIELYEVYQNQTRQRQEVVYYFSLPESAVVTGVWLGNSPDRSERFVYQVAPRGAAQAAYRNEIRRRIDPALVEQIGPRQYRLRIFPVEAMNWDWDPDTGRSTETDGPALHMWLTWRVMQTEAGWPLPHLAEKRNVYWDHSTVRLLDGQPLAVEGENWLPPALPATTLLNPAPHRVDFPGGETVLALPQAGLDLPALPSTLHLAVVLDRSRSMAKHEGEVEQALARLDELAAGGATVDLYLTAAEFRGEGPTRIALAERSPGDLLFFGGQNAAELLAQFAELSQGRTYDAVLVLTDGSGYELGQSQVTVPSFAAPLWMVHLGGDISVGYDDDTLEAIQSSGGGVVTTVEEGLLRLAVGLGGPGLPAGALADLRDGYLWLTMPTEAIPDDLSAVEEAFGPLAARQLILSRMQHQRETLQSVETLDRLHALASDQSIVTPYSSMIVLVSYTQQRRLDQLERRADRFEREYEAVGETEEQDPILVTGVPEPEEWLLLILAVAMLGWWYVYQRRLGSSGVKNPGNEGALPGA